MFSVEVRVLLMGYILCNTEAYVFRGCFKYNMTLFMNSAQYAEYIPEYLSAPSCLSLCQRELNLTTLFALADQKMCYCDSHVKTFNQLGQVNDVQCRNYCQRSLNDTKYCGQFDRVALYGVSADGEDVTEPPTECKPLNGPTNGDVRYEPNGSAVVECHDGYSPSSHHLLECQFINGTYSWNGTVPLCRIANPAVDEMTKVGDSQNALIVIGVVCGVIVLSVMATGVIYFCIKRKTRTSSFEIEHHPIKRLRPTIERVDGDGTHTPDTEHTHAVPSHQEQIGQSAEKIPLEYVPSEEHKDGYDHPPQMRPSSPENLTNPPIEQPLDRNSANRSTYNYVSPQPTYFDDNDDNDDNDEEYDLPIMDSSPYQESYFEFSEEMVSERVAEPEPGSTQILMNIDMANVFAPGYSRVSKQRGEDGEEVMEEVVQYMPEEEEGPEEFYLEPNL